MLAGQRSTTDHQISQNIIQNADSLVVNPPRAPRPRAIVIEVRAVLCFIYILYTSTNLTAPPARDTISNLN